MKITVNRPTEIEATHVDVCLPIDKIDNLPADFPMRAGDVWKARIDIATGQIEDWPAGAGTRHLYLMPRDSGTYRLILVTPGEGAKQVAEITNNYVPNLLIPGSDGDYVDLEIDHRGRVTNWPRRPDISQFFRDKFVD